MKCLKKIYISAVSFITKSMPVVVSRPKVALTALCCIVLPVVALLSGLSMLLEEKKPR